jgi:hypothetical protein
MYVFGLVLWSCTLALGLLDLVLTDRMQTWYSLQRQLTFERYGEDHRGWRILLRFLAPGTRRGVRWHGLWLLLGGATFLLGQILWYS